jgi:general secretion pathway protein M
MSTDIKPGWLAPKLARWQAFWNARTPKERSYLTVGGSVVLLALAYLLLIEPAVDGRARLERELPSLHQQNAQLQALAQEAAALGNAGGAQAAPVTREALEQSLTRYGMKPQSVALLGDFAKVQLNGVPFAKLTAWLDETQRVSRATVQDANLVAQPAPGTVNAALTLRVKR